MKHYTPFAGMNLIAEIRDSYDNGEARVRKIMAKYKDLNFNLPFDCKEFPRHLETKQQYDFCFNLGKQHRKEFNNKNDFLCAEEVIEQLEADDWGAKLFGQYGFNSWIVVEYSMGWEFEDKQQKSKETKNEHLQTN